MWHNNNINFNKNNNTNNHIVLIQDVYYANLSIRMMKKILFVFSCAFVGYASVEYWNITFSFAISIILCLGFWKIFCWCHSLNSTIYQCTLLIKKKLLTKLIPINYNYTIFTPILRRWTSYCYEMNNYS